MIELNRFDDPRKFQSAVVGYLLQREAENNLLLGILTNLISGEYQEHPPYLVSLENGGEIRLVLIRTPPFPVLLSYAEDLLETQLLALMIDDLFESFGDQLTGITAAKKIAAQTAEAWQIKTGKKPVLKMAMRIYKLTDVNPVRGVSGQLRPANNNDLPLIKEWYGNFHRDALREEPDPEQVAKQASRYLLADPSQRGLMFWEDGGKPVSMAGYAGPTTNGIRIGAVYTPNKLRRKGYASACTAALSQYLLDAGFKFCFLFTDLINPTSNHIYQQIGYRSVCDVDTYDFK